MRDQLKIFFLTFLFSLFFFAFACDDKTQSKKQPQSHTVSGKISQPVHKNKVKKEAQKSRINSEEPLRANMEKIGTKDETQFSNKQPEQEIVEKVSDHYDVKGKIDPFKPLIQENPPKAQPIADNRPKRMLTPLEKIEWNQIRLVAVIIMENRRIAMVEETSGKGYEVGIGTYIGKNQGQVSEIRKSSIVIKEPVRDYKGRLKERVQEIKLHKIEGEE